MQPIPDEKLDSLELFTATAAARSAANKAMQKAKRTKASNSDRTIKHSVLRP